MYEYRFPKDFLIGTANSAFQSEGAWNKDGKSENMMEYFARTYAGKPIPGSLNAKTVKIVTEDLPYDGCFFYDNYEAYIDDMAKTGQNTFRLSLSWCRIIPTGVGEVNPKGIAFYNKVIDKLLSCGITPFVDLNHWDLPQCLYEDGGGFRNPRFPEWFEAYAKVCFEAFGDRVKLWSTFNEACVSINAGYAAANFPPYEKSRPGALLAAHNLILAHFRAVRLYRSMNLGGKIGVVHCLSPASPVELTDENLDAVQRNMTYQLAWWTDPMVNGKYPEWLIQNVAAVRNTMPENYQEDLDQWFAPMDFLGINYYIVGRTQLADNEMGFKGATSFYSEPGQAYAPYPPGLMDTIQYAADMWPGLDIYITENGCCLRNINDEEAECDDPQRISYLREHLRMIARCIRAGYPVKGYYYWNDADSYEIQDGYRLRFGLTWVDHKTGRRRWKKSRHYFSQICKTHLVD